MGAVLSHRWLPSVFPQRLIEAERPPKCTPNYLKLSQIISSYLSYLNWSGHRSAGLAQLARLGHVDALGARAELDLHASNTGG